MGLITNYSCPVWPCKWTYRPSADALKHTPEPRLQEVIKEFIMGHLAGTHGINSLEELQETIEKNPTELEKMAAVLMGDINE